MQSEAQVSVYGRSGPNCSFVTVTDGWLHALEIIAGQTGNPELLTQLVTTEQNLQAVMDSPTPTALVTDPHALPLAMAFDHSVYYLVLAPHSAFLPDEYLAAMRRLGSRLHLFPPSEFSANCLRQLGFEQVEVVEHGVDPSFCPLTAGELEAMMNAESSTADLRGEGINLLHLAAGDLDRKSTEALIEACTRLIDDNWNLTLTMVLAGPERARLAIRTIRDPRLRQRLRFLPRVSAPPSKMRWLYCAFDFVVQPSRVEGFGMCPLEALCCGVPAIVSQGTGHAQWLRHGTEGVVQVPLGPAGPMASEPNPCPTVSVVSIMDAILCAITNREQLSTDAAVAAPDRIRRHSWTKAITGVFD